MSARALHRSFAGGEITPELYGRLDLVKYQTGLSLCSNFAVLPHGPVARRPGFSFVNEAWASTTAVRILPFAFNADQTVVLEFGHQYIRFFINGEALLETPQPIVSIVAGVVNVNAHGWSTGDWVFIGSRFHRIVVSGTDTFTTTDTWGNPTVASGATAARVYTLTTPYTASDLFDLHYAQDSDVLTITHAGYAHAARDLARVSATSWTLTPIDFTPSTSVPGGVGVAATVGTPGNQNPQSYCVTAIGADGVSESLQSATVSTSNNLTVSGNYNTVTWSAVTGATAYNIYKQRGGAFGYIGQTLSGTLSLVDDNVLADTTKTPPEDKIDLNDAPERYPAAVTYHEQRRWFAGASGAPQTVWATRTATQSNLTGSTPSQDDDGMQFRIAARQQNAIRHLLPLSDLIVLTVGGEFRLYADNAPSISPSSLTIKPQGYSGASNVQPALTSGSILYVQAQGSHVREMSFNWQANAYASIDISIMAPHLFSGFTVVDLAFVRAPTPTLWVVRSDGALLGMTYVPEQQVYAWHQHHTLGAFESVCVVAEGAEDVLYAVVRREIAGRTVRYIERMSSQVVASQADAFFVDSGLTYAGAPVNTLTGLWHLEGEEVDVLTDGAVHPRVTVTGGAITLDYEASKVSVGLPYVSDIMTLPLAFEQAPAGGQGVLKNVSELALRVTNSAIVKAGPTFTDLTEYPARAVSDPYGSPPALRTGELRFDIGPDWNPDGGVCVRQDAPLPLTILSMALGVATGG